MARLRFAAKSAPYRGFGSEIVRAVGHFWLRAFGWRINGDWPAIDKAVLVAAPHTSNWDGFHMLAAAAHYRIKLRWMGKDSLGKGPMGWIARRAGLVPVDRSGGKDMVGQAAKAFSETDAMVLAVAPEGTRSYTPGWKTGFYHIAHTAGVPILMAVLDYATHTITVVGPIETSGDVETDLPLIQAPYAQARGRRPGAWSPTEED
ncbi:MAG: 1-acyl-sn-glycerol-3-phosphate acyltransferase [Pseudomonadota bacterium]